MTELSVLHESTKLPRILNLPSKGQQLAVLQLILARSERV